MIIKNVRYIAGNTDFAKCPEPVHPEYVFTGRSNVGKSSLINMLAGISGLARISSGPGKTRLINHFLVNESWYLVDLPGYGYAKTSQENRRKWRKMIFDFLLYRKNILSIFVLIDSRLEPQENDIEFINWLGENNLPLIITFTKADKLSGSLREKNIAFFQKHLLNYWEEMPPVFVTSARTGTGKEEILNYIGNTNKVFDHRILG